MFERQTAAGEILGESAPRGEVQLVGFLELREVAFQARALGQQAENAALVEDVDVILPHHVIDGRQLLAVADQRGSQACDAILHAGTFSGTGSESAKPAR